MCVKYKHIVKDDKKHIEHNTHIEYNICVECDMCDTNNRPVTGRKDNMPTHTKGQMSEAARQARNAAARAWRAKNKDKVKEYNRRYWENKAGKGAQNGENV